MIERIPTMNKVLFKLPADVHGPSQDADAEDRGSAIQGQTATSKFKDSLASTDPVSQDRNRTKQGWRYSSMTELLLSICKASGSVSGNPQTKPN